MIISLFTADLKLRMRLRHPVWWIPVRLAFVSMAITVGLIAPTDPVLASDVQVEHPLDRDRLRFGLTGEAGLNDGAAFPFVMLGLGLLGLHYLWLALAGSGCRLGDSGRAGRGLALRHIELQANQEQTPEAVQVSATVLSSAVLRFCGSWPV